MLVNKGVSMLRHSIFLRKTRHSRQCETCADQKEILRVSSFRLGWVQLQTRVGSTKFYHFKTHTLENRGGGGSGPPVFFLDPRMWNQVINGVYLVSGILSQTILCYTPSIQSIYEVYSFCHFCNDECVCVCL